jgi:signal transduction histidine kinase
VALAKELRQRYPTPDDAPTGAPQVARTGRAELYPEIPDELLARSAPDPEQLRLVRALGLRSAMVVPLMALGRPLGAMTLVSAESGRRFEPADLAFAEELGRRAGLALENARLYRAALDAVKLRDDFLSVAGHELKTPLTALTLQVASLLRAYAGERAPAPGDAVGKLTRIASTAARLERLVTELLDVSRITSGRLALERQHHDLVAIAREVVGRFAEQAARDRTPIELIAPAALEGTWDGQRLDQVLTNLLSNALKYGPGRPVRVRVAADETRRARLSVEDEGIGIAPADQERIFDRFERAIPDRNYGGLGLGLWIARQIVEAHGGQIRVQSAPGRGSTFEVLLPL